MCLKNRFQLRKALKKIFNEHKHHYKIKIQKDWRPLAQTPSASDLLNRKEDDLKVILSSNKLMFIEKCYKRDEQTQYVLESLINVYSNISV